jgi:hypothetical protein
MGRRRPPEAEEGTQCQASDLRFVRTEDVVLADSGDTDRSWCEADLAHNNDALAEGTWIGIDAGGRRRPRLRTARQQTTRSPVDVCPAANVEERT